MIYFISVIFCFIIINFNCIDQVISDCFNNDILICSTPKWLKSVTFSSFLYKYQYLIIMYISSKCIPEPDYHHFMLLFLITHANFPHPPPRCSCIAKIQIIMEIVFKSHHLDNNAFSKVLPHSHFLHVCNSIQLYLLCSANSQVQFGERSKRPC